VDIWQLIAIGGKGCYNPERLDIGFAAGYMMSSAIKMVADTLINLAYKE